MRPLSADLPVASMVGDRAMATGRESALESALVVEFAGRSAIGNVRERNEDRLGWLAVDGAAPPAVTPADEAVVERHVLESPEPLFFTVADGLGAYGGGDIAAGLAVEACLGHARSSGAGGRVGGLLRSAFLRANQTVFDAALRGDGGAGRKMQSTLTTLVLTPGEAWLAHVGDCRVYRRRGESLDILTSDHSQVMELLRMRLISPDQAVDHPARYALTRSLGGDITVRVDVRSEPLLPGDTFLLCSDGLWSSVPTAGIRDSLSLPPAEACARLVEMALDGGGDDNATAMAIHVSRAGSKAPAAEGWRRFFS